jgi:PKD repeat protein
MNGKTGYAVKNSVASKVSLIFTHNYLSGNPAQFYPSSLTDTNPATSPNSKLGNVTSSVQSELPSANFTCNVTNGYAPLSVQFADLSKSASSWKWDFGDGRSSTQKNTTHIYSTAGSYTVKLTVKNAKGENSKTCSISVIKKEEISTLLVKNDNRMREASPENVFSNSEFLDLGGMNGVGRYRDVLSFDLSGIKSTTQIKSAKLFLYWYHPNNSRLKDTIVEIYRPSSTWNPNYVSWNKRDKGIAWSKAGGSWYDKKGVLQGSTPYATLTMKASTSASNSYCELDVTDLVKGYVGGKYKNTGFLIKARSESDNYIAFYSADNVNKSLVPKLKLVYG